jgi:general secretion pathway protein G
MNKPRHGKGRAGRGGFTLVEMLLVLVILATLAAVVIPKLAGRGQQAKQTAAQTDVKNIEGALDAFEVDNGEFPKDLNSLVEQPSDAKNWRGPYVSDIPNDPWGYPYVYEQPGKHHPKSFDLYSVGKDGQANTDDDVTNWSTNANN